MFVVGLLGWWYGTGWRGRLQRLQQQLASGVDYFSIGTLFLTLFDPFRQISAGRINGPLPVMLRALVDRIVSRVIGTIVRSGTIVIGIVFLASYAVVGSVAVILWAFVPMLPIIGIVLAISGWVPA